MPQRQYVPNSHKNRNARISLVVAVVALLFFVPPVRRPVFAGVRGIGIGIDRGTHAVGSFFGGFGSLIDSKYALQTENTALETQVAALNERLASLSALTAENADLEAAMGRPGVSPHFTLAAILAKPPQSAYDTLMIDGGSAVGIASGETVYANGVTPIGTIAEVNAHTALVSLYSTPGTQTEARLAPEDIDVTLTGLGGGDFSTTVPHDLAVTSGASAVTKDIDPNVIAVFETVTSDPRDPLQTLLLAAPINVNSLSFVEVRQAS